MCLYAKRLERGRYLAVSADGPVDDHVFVNGEFSGAKAEVGRCPGEALQIDRG